MNAIIERLRNNPVLVNTLVGALLVLLVQAGVPIRDGLANAISALVVAVLAIFTRSQVVPLRNTSHPDNVARREAGAADVGLGLLIAAVLGIALLLFGVRFGR
jgi:hypothetical protein